MDMKTKLSHIDCYPIDKGCPYNASAGNWHNGSSIQVPLAGHLARAGKVTLPAEEETHFRRPWERAGRCDF